MHIYASHDQGESWAALAIVSGQYWSNLFIRDDGVYVLGTSSDGYAGEGSIALSRSTDSGVTWQRQVFCVNICADFCSMGLHIRSVDRLDSQRSPVSHLACLPALQIIVPAPDAATGSYATGATPLLVSKGRLWRGLELWAAPHRQTRQQPSCKHAA